MQLFRSRYKKGTERTITLLLVLFSLHFMSIHGFADALVLCFEDNGQVNIESEAGSLFSIPSEQAVHAEDEHHHEDPTLGTSQDNHHDVPLSIVCSKEQQITRFDQDRTLSFLDGVVNTKIEQLAPSRVFQLVSFIPPLIENVITTSLQTVVLLN